MSRGNGLQNSALANSRTSGLAVHAAKALQEAGFQKAELVCLVGSRAQGTDGPESDYDFRGFHDSNHHAALADAEYDLVLHSADDFLAQLIKGKVSVMDAVHGPVAVSGPVGQAFVDHRAAFVSKKSLEPLMEIIKGHKQSIENQTGGSGRDYKPEKVVWHFYRLIEQAKHLATTGIWKVEAHPLQKENIDLSPDLALASYEDLIQEIKYLIKSSPLPSEPDQAVIQKLSKLLETNKPTAGLLFGSRKKISTTDKAILEMQNGNCGFYLQNLAEFTPQENKKMIKSYAENSAKRALSKAGLTDNNLQKELYLSYFHWISSKGSAISEREMEGLPEIEFLPHTTAFAYLLAKSFAPKDTNWFSTNQMMSIAKARSEFTYWQRPSIWKEFDYLLLKNVTRILSKSDFDWPTNIYTASKSHQTTLNIARTFLLKNISPLSSPPVIDLKDIINSKQSNRNTILQLAKQLEDKYQAQENDLVVKNLDFKAAKEWVEENLPKEFKIIRTKRLFRKKSKANYKVIKDKNEEYLVPNISDDMISKAIERFVDQARKETFASRQQADMSLIALIIEEFQK